MTQTPLVPVEKARDHKEIIRDLVQQQTDAFNRDAPESEKLELLNKINKIKEDQTRMEKGR